MVGGGGGLMGEKWCAVGGGGGLMGVLWEVEVV